ncbi:YifB family Mg chelatase-like AAA ATPase [Pseudoroseomonas ludipueritiae]|uniref:YifB family Mg chelatase-like AAA ATPase n=1 Tax=Pseudoroseomonas ludipueritiae TaxID=198093 RepID=A0ABR7R564_9PROT|nr:YifB family Mg chelatase-like AAA ATPase [Pseudoroseomonas ludipueritiae]MBC9176883.1 YifB family Mg chelatase-like AAA ATPase [Pseudoroseomonas ludipueritiae]
MTIARLATFAFSGIETLPVEVQVQISAGLPAFTVVGLPDKAVAESRERVRAALTGLGLSLPPKRVLVNLAPANIQKEGSHFDLPIALAVLAAMEVVPREELAGFAALGELALDGTVGPVAGILPAALGAAARGLGLICPGPQGDEAAWVGEIEILAADDLRQFIAHLTGRQILDPPKPPGLQPETAPGLCLSDVKGQESAKRALEIAAAGQHNLLLVGPPGAGKSMLAARLPGLLPDLTPQEALEVSLVRSVAGLIEQGRISARPPFREPHHSASQAALVGGGPGAKPGEISLAHRGVLFLDEWPEFPRPALEALRQPLESGTCTVSRAAAHVTYPARVQLVAAMNPCRCGHLGDGPRECGQAPRCGEQYQSRLSGPLLDRIDLTIGMAPIAPGELARAPKGETSGVVAARVARARQAQHVRAGTTNAEAPLDALTTQAAPEALALAEKASAQLGLSNRGFIRCFRVARSIADLAGEGLITRTHMAEALAFRQRLPGGR